MNPSTIVYHLRRIAAAIDNSAHPSRTLVARDLQRLIRQAGRTDVLLNVERACDAQGVYPPDMKSVGKDTYEGEIDVGWMLNVEEAPDGSVKAQIKDDTGKRRFRGDLDGAISFYKKNKGQKAPASSGAFSGSLGFPHPDRSLPGIDVKFTIKHLSMSPDGLFHVIVDFHWEAPSASGKNCVNDVTSDTSFRQVPDYDSADNKTSLIVNGQPATYWHDAEEKGLFDADFMTDSTGRSWEFFHDDEFCDMAMREFFKAKHPDLLSKIQSDDFDDSAELKKEVYEAAPDDGVFI